VFLRYFPVLPMRRGGGPPPSWVVCRCRSAWLLLLWASRESLPFSPSTPIERRSKGLRPYAARLAAAAQVLQWTATKWIPSWTVPTTAVREMSTGAGGAANERGAPALGCPLVWVWLPVRGVDLWLDVNDPRVVAEVGRDVDRRGHADRRVDGRGSLGGGGEAEDGGSICRTR